MCNKKRATKTQVPFWFLQPLGTSLTPGNTSVICPLHNTNSKNLNPDSNSFGISHNVWHKIFICGTKTVFRDLETTLTVGLDNSANYTMPHSSSCCVDTVHWTSLHWERWTNTHWFYIFNLSIWPAVGLRQDCIQKYLNTSCKMKIAKIWRREKILKYCKMENR